MKFTAFTSEFTEYSPARVGVLASPEATAQICLAIREQCARDLHSIDWSTVKGHLATAQTQDSPDIVVCEIQNPVQAQHCRQEIKLLWPQATLLSCAAGGSDLCEGEVQALESISQQAGYQGHFIINDAALQLPIFLRYAEQRRVFDQQAHQLLHLKKLLQVSNRLHASLDQQQVAEDILAEFSQWVAADNWQLYVVSEDGKFIELIGSEGVRVKPPGLILQSDGDGAIERVLQSGQAVWLTADELKKLELNREDRRSGDLPAQAIGSVLCFPLIVDNQIVGIGQATRIEGGAPFSEQQILLLQEVAEIAAGALNNANRFAQAERLFMQDDLTQLHNSRYLRQFLENEYKRVRRYGGQVAVIFIDLDGFKGVNDHFGHRVGSDTLKEMAHLLMDSVRDTDVVTRYGGDEFTIVLPNTNSEKALVTAERIRRKLANHVFCSKEPNTFRLTASFGIASYPECSAQSYVELLEKADMAMYEAKADNKNNVKLARH